MTATVVIGAQGRLVLPADVRRQLGLEAGDELSLRVEGKTVVLQRPTDAAEKLLGLVGSLDGRSLVDELIAERRAAAASGE